MKLMFPGFSNPIEIKEEEINILVIENARYFIAFLNDIWQQKCKGKGSAVLSENNTPISISTNVEVISQFVPFEINDRLILTKLFKDLKSSAYSEENYLNTQELSKYLNNYMLKLSDSTEVNLGYEGFDIGYIFKCLGVKIEDCYDTITEKIYEYIKTIRELEGEKVFIFINLKSYLDEKQLLQLYEMIILNKFNVLFVESSQRKLLNNEKLFIIDEDLCEIL